MNANRNYVIGALLAATLALTACGSNVPSDADPKPYTGATSSASAPATTPATPPATAPVLGDPKKDNNPLGAPSVSDEEAAKNKAEFEAKPLGADVDAMFANPERVSADVLTVFPEDKNNTKQVVREAMALYQTIAVNDTFHKARPEGFTNDGNVLDAYTGNIDIDFINEVKKRASDNPNYPGVTEHFVATSSNGLLEYSDLRKYKLPDNAFSASFNEPSVRIANLGTLEQPVDVIHIETDVHYSYSVVGIEGTETAGFKGKFSATNTINIDVLPLENGKWIIKKMGRTQAVNAALVADAKVPNA